MIKCQHKLRERFGRVITSFSPRWVALWGRDHVFIHRFVKRGPGH